MKLTLLFSALVTYLHAAASVIVSCMLLVLWCSHNNLELHMLYTVELTVDLRRHHPPPLTVSSCPMSPVDSLKFLGTAFSKNLERIITPILQLRMYFLCQWRKFGMAQKLLIQFYTAVAESDLRSSNTLWLRSATTRDRSRDKL